MELSVTPLRPTNKVCATASPLDALQAVSRVIADPVPAPV